MIGPRSQRAFAVLIGFLLLMPGALAASDYSLSGSPEIETPTRTITHQGTNYTIDSVGRIAPGESITVSTDVPEGAAYDLNLRGPDNQLIVNERKTGETTHTFSYFGSGEAGSYAATIQDGGSTVAAYPIVIQGYDISVTPPESVEAGEETNLSATVTERSVDKHSTLDEVQVVVGNDDVEIKETMANGDGNNYTTTISTDGLDPDTYNVYVAVRGDETVRGEAELVGVSDIAELTVTEPTPTPTSTDSGGGSAGGTGGLPASTATEQNTATLTEVGPSNATATRTTTANITETTTEDPSTTTERRSQTAQSTADSTAQPTVVTASPSTTATQGGSQGVIDPETETPETPISGSGPGFTLLASLLAVIGAGLLAIRRSR